MTEPDREPDAEAGLAAEVDEIEVEWTTAVHQAVLDMEEARARAEADAEVQRQALAAIWAAEWDALTPGEREAREAAAEAERYQEHQAYLEEQAEAELFEHLETEIGEPEIGD